MWQKLIVLEIYKSAESYYILRYHSVNCEKVPIIAWFAMIAAYELLLIFMGKIEIFIWPIHTCKYFI